MRQITGAARIALLFLLCSTLSATQCGQYRNYPIVRYADILHLEPVKKEYAVGDTLWMSYHNPSLQFTRVSTGEKVRLDSMSVTINPAISADYSPNPDSTGNYFSFITGSGIDPEISQTVYGETLIARYGCNTGGSYDFRLGIVLRKTGFFVLNLQPAVPVETCPDRVNGARGIELTFTFDAPDLNADVFQTATDTVKADLRDVFAGKIRDRQAFAILVR